MQIDQDESPLSRLKARRGRNGEAFLSDEEFQAGEALRADFTRGQLMPGIGQRWDTQPRQKRAGIAAHDLSDSALDARARVNAAVAAIGPELAGVLLDICCFLKGLETVERERQWPARSAKLMLKTGLASLSRHYGLDSRSTGRSGRIRRWGTADYRPTIDGRQTHR